MIAYLADESRAQIRRVLARQDLELPQRLQSRAEPRPLPVAVGDLEGQPETDPVLLPGQPVHPLRSDFGAEGMYGLAWQKDGVGFGLTLKISDGDGQRARFSAALEALRQLEVLSGEDAADLRSRFVGEIRNHRGLVVGSVGTTFRLV